MQSIDNTQVHKQTVRNFALNPTLTYCRLKLISFEQLVQKKTIPTHPLRKLLGSLWTDEGK